jgi:hypothetical protein
MTGVSREQSNLCQDNRQCGNFERMCGRERAGKGQWTVAQCLSLREQKAVLTYTASKHPHTVQVQSVISSCPQIVCLLRRGRYKDPCHLLGCAWNYPITRLNAESDRLGGRRHCAQVSSSPPEQPQLPMQVTSDACKLQ